MWSFNRLRDSVKVKKEEIFWQGPFAWPGFENINDLKPIPDVQGVYLFTFRYQKGYLLYSAGITNSTKRRISEHYREYRKGNYNILDVKSAENGKRVEIWHGWQYAKTHQDEFHERKETILDAVETQLQSFRIFIAEISDKRRRERIEAAVMHDIYASKETWSELADRGTHLTMRNNSEMPIEIENTCSEKLYGLPVILEI